MRFEVKLERINGRQILNFPAEMEVPWKTMLIRKEADETLTLLPGRREDREALEVKDRTEV